MRRVRAACVLASAAWLGGCPLVVPNAKIAPYLQEVLGPSWTMVPLPNTALKPGAIVQVVKAVAPQAGGAIDLRLLGTLADCAVPPAAALVSQAGVPGMAAGATVAVDASLGARLAGVSAEIAANAGAKTALTITEAMDSTLDYIVFQRWAADPAHAAALRQACGPILAQPGIYVVQEAFVVSAGSFTFTNSAGGKIAVVPPPGVPVQAGVDVQTGQSGALTITQPIVFALKVLAPLPQGGFEVAALSAAPHALAARARPAPLAAPAPAPLMLGGIPIRAVSLSP